MDTDPYKNQPQNYQKMDPNYEHIQKTFGDPLNLRFTPEEAAVLEECRRTAIYQRGLPLAAVATGGFHYMMKTGMIKRNVYTLIVSGITGFLVGTTSYRSVCIEKLMALPNSTLKERILAAQGVQPARADLQSDNQVHSWVDVQPNFEAPRTPMGSSLDVEPYHNYNDSFYGANPVDTEAAFALDPPLKPAASDNYTSYDEMRRRNREEYERSQSQKFRSSRPEPPPPPPLAAAFDSRFDRPFEPQTYDPPKRDDFL